MEHLSFSLEVMRLSRLVQFKSLGVSTHDIDNTNVDSECYRLLSSFDPIQGKVLPEFLTALLNLAPSLANSGVNVFSNHPASRCLNLFSPRHAFYPREFSYLGETFTYSSLQEKIEREVVQCGKTVFIGKSSELKMEYEFLAQKYPNIKFFMGTKTVQSYPSGISFRYAWRSRLVKSFKTLTEAGVWTWTEGRDLSTKNFNRTPAVIMRKSKDFSPTDIATLSGTWPTVFILVGGLISVTIPVFIMEFRRRIGLLIGNMYRLIVFKHQKFRKIVSNTAIPIFSYCFRCVSRKKELLDS